MKKVKTRFVSGIIFPAKKLQLIMKLSIFFLTVCCLNVTAKGFSQKKISVAVTKAELPKIFAAIQNMSDYKFLYQGEDDLKKIKKSIHVTDATVENVMGTLLQNTGYEYKLLENNLIVLYRTEVADIIIQGKITNEKGEPLSGATITVKGTKTTTTADSEGNFSIKLQENEARIIISYIGYENYESHVSGNTTLNIVLKESIKEGDDVVVVGYGTQKKAKLTGAIASVSGETITQRPAPTLQNLLQGRIVGLDIVQPTGEPGRDAGSFRIRGIGSYGASTSPLVLVDGVIGSLSNLSPQDIEDVTVLKDAASAAIYGARSANGVILVTTKKGRTGKNTIEYTASLSSSEATRRPELITDAPTYMQMYNTANARLGRAPQYTQAQIDLYKNNPNSDQYPSFDWIGYALGKASTQNHGLRFSGGVAKTTYNISLNYLNQDGIMKNYSHKRYNALLDFATQAHERVRVGVNINFSYQDIKAPWQTNDGLLLLAYAAAPTFKPFLPDGRIAHSDFSTNNSGNRTIEEVYNTGGQFTKNYNVNAQGFVEVDIIRGLKWYTKAAVTFFNQDYKNRQYRISSYAYQPETNGTNTITGNGNSDFVGLQQSSARNITKTLYSTLSYTKTFNTVHNISALAGYEQQDNVSNNLGGQRFNFPNNTIMELNGSTSVNQNTSGSSSEWAIQSLFGRIGYDYKGKYIVEGNIRYDGTSRVDPRFRWGTFGGGSAAWRVSEEGFIKNNLSWISNLKLRASYGVLGNQEIGNYPFQDVLALTTYPFTTISPGAVLTALRVKDLKWEKTAITDYGVDIDLFKGLFGATIDWYKKNTTDILAQRTDLPASVGLSAPIVNAGAVQNTGIEIELRHQNNIGELTYGANIMYHAYKNKITKVLAQTVGTFEVGQPLNNFFMYEWVGIFQNQEEINKWAKQPSSGTLRPGDLKIRDLDGNGTVGPEDRIRYNGNPKFNYSFGLNAGWKGLTVSAFFQGVEGQNVRVADWGYEPFAQGSAPPKKFLDAWSPANPSNTVPALYIWNSYAGVNGYNSTYFLQDASYLRLKNLYLSYSVPQGIVRKIKSQGITVFASADNLATWTKYEGNDPERAGSGRFAQFPQLKTISGGINIKF